MIRKLKRRLKYRKTIKALVDNKPKADRKEFKKRLY